MEKNKPFIFTLSFFLGLGICLGGCSNKSKQRSLEAYVKQVESQTVKQIEPLPELKPNETFTYGANNLRSPFVPSFPVETAKKEESGNGIHPDTTRHKEPLELFPLDSLRMVGTLDKQNKKWALLVDPTGTVYRVKQGNYIGQNYGHVDKINDDKIDLTEIIPDPNGGWRERKASIALVDESQKKHKISTEHPK